MTPAKWVIKGDPQARRSKLAHGSGVVVGGGGGGSVVVGGGAGVEPMDVVGAEKPPELGSLGSG